MKTIESPCIIVGPQDHRYPYSYRFYASTIPGNFKKGEFFLPEWHSLDFGKEALVILHKVKEKGPGVNTVDSKGRLNFTPPAWIFPNEVREEKPTNYGSFSKGEFDFSEEEG